MTQKASVRMEEIRRRTRRLRQRRAHRINCALSAVCLFLTVGIASLLYQEHVPGLSIVLAGYGSVLLHSGADAYIVVSVGSFVTGVVFTLLGIRYRRYKTCWVFVKQFSRNDTATACQDWLRSTRLGRGSIKSHVRTVKVLGMGLFAFQERVHLWKGVTH